MTRTSQIQSTFVVIIDDDPNHLELMSLALADSVSSGSAAEFCVRGFNDPADALSQLQDVDSLVILCDYSMPGGNGLDWLPDLLRSSRGPVILMTGQGDEQIAARAFRAGAADYLIKSRVLDDPELLRKSIRDALRRHRLQECNRELTRELSRANRQLKERNRQLDELTKTAHRFVEDVAHEFRTPLTVIKEFASIMTDGLGGAVTEKQSECLDFISASTRDLAQLVDDFLDSSKLKARKLRVDRSRHTAVELLDVARPMLQCRASARKIQLVERIEDDLMPFFGDLEKAERVLINLVVNAVKFSAPGGNVIITAETGENGDVRFGVTDEGPGLSPENVRVLFDRFRQFDAAGSAEVKGFGLGLNIVRDLVWLNLGDVFVESEPGTGSTFSFTMPSCDAESIVERYLDRLGAGQETISVSVLNATTGDSTPSVHELRRMLAGTCYPMDLILETSEGDGLLILGHTDKPDKWMKSLHAAYDAATDDPEHTGGPLHLRWMGSWSYPSAKETIVAQVVNHVLEFARSA